MGLSSLLGLILLFQSIFFFGILHTILILLESKVYWDYWEGGFKNIGRGALRILGVLGILGIVGGHCQTPLTIFKITIKIFSQRGL
jgi:hypothetical protein